MVKGYGDTYERGWRNFSSLLEQVTGLQNRADGAAIFARLQEAALADDVGSELARELAAIKHTREPMNHVNQRPTKDQLREVNP